jgi:hypothetical protein
MLNVWEKNYNNLKRTFRSFEIQKKITEAMLAILTIEGVNS